MRTFYVIGTLILLMSCGLGSSTQQSVKMEEKPVSLKLKVATNQSALKQVRGVWITNVDSDVLFSQDSIAIAMETLAKQGFNVVFPVVWNKAMTLYPSEIMAKTFGDAYKQDSVLVKAGIDPLAIITVEAHRWGMEVIPWFEFGFSSSYNENGGHLVRLRPDWAAKDSAGNLLKKNNFEWLNGIHPEVQQLMTDLILEVVENYDIDGIQGDDRLPAMPAHGDFSDFTRDLYKKETGLELPISSNSIFMRWKANKLNDFARNLYSQVKSKNSELIVSFSPSVYPWSYDHYLQDSPSWVNGEYVDLLIPQVYRYEIDRYKTTLDDVLTYHPGILQKGSKTTLASGILIKAGPKYNTYTDYVKEAIRYNRERSVPGEVFFFFEGLDEKNGFLGDSLAKHEYAQKAGLPYRTENYRPFVHFQCQESESELSKIFSVEFEKTGVYDAYTKVYGTASIEYKQTNEIQTAPFLSDKMGVYGLWQKQGSLHVIAPGSLVIKLNAVADSTPELSKIECFIVYNVKDSKEK